MGKIIVGILLGLVLALGFGSGTGNGTGNGEKTVVVDDENNTDDEKSDENTSSTIIVSIDEDKVTLNHRVFDNKDDLKLYVQTIYTDDKTWILESDHAILSTYEWVVEVFDELSINLKK